MSVAALLRRALPPAALASFISSISAATFHVAPSGNDQNSGAPDAPFATVQRAHDAASAGDTVLIHGGTYRLTEAQIANRSRGRARVTFLTKSGKPENPIRFWAAEGEQPIFDFSAVKPAGLRVTAFEIGGSWIHLKGLTVIGVQVTIKTHTQSICFDNEGSHNTYEQLTMRDGQAIGFWLGKGSDNLVLNCDAYRNYDSTSEGGRGGNTDGFGFHPTKGSVRNVFRGCRAWFNSDDGFDFIWAAEPVMVENCWAFYNGFDAKFTSIADGNGFKAGGYARLPEQELPKTIPRHVLKNCLAVHNKAYGFYANHHPGGIDLINNTAFRNKGNFNLLGRNVADTNDVPGYGHRLKNNLGFKGGREVLNLNEAACELAGNYFQLPVKVSAEDFAGLDESDLTKPRKANGDLPDVPLLRLVKGSDLIDRGVEAGLPYRGKAPDLGAFESRE